MGDISQLKWIKNNKELIKGDILELGARHYDSETAIDYRKEFSNERNYIGADISKGRNVDIEFDLTENIDKIKSVLQKDNFDTIICCSVLEHVKDIYKAANNISDLMGKDGVLFLSVPFSWEYHGYPTDFWRFTPGAVEFLFKDFEFPVSLRTISSNYLSDMSTLNDNPNSFILRKEIIERHWHINNGMYRKFLMMKDMLFDKEYRKERIIQHFLGKEYRLALSCINMVGIKK